MTFRKTIYQSLRASYLGYIIFLVRPQIYGRDMDMCVPCLSFYLMCGLVCHFWMSLGPKLIPEVDD
jgi:hypothetical protein